MINVDVREYCSMCLKFDPVVTHRPEAFAMLDDECEYIGSTIVKCTHREECNQIFMHISSTISAKKENKNA